MAETFKPADEQQLNELIAWAVAEEIPLEIMGSGSKRGLGRPVEAGHVVDLSGLSGIVEYEPSELLVVTGPGTSLVEVQHLLAEHNQMLAFEPPNWGWLLHGESHPGTIGGAIAVASAGPRRMKAGGARDHLLGARSISGRGELFISGSRVVKNVTGYDLPKLLTGSYGTLAAFSELNIKTLPAPEKTYTLLIYGLGEAEAVAAMRDAAGSPYEVSGVSYLPAPAACASSVDCVSVPGKSVAAIRFEGPKVSVEHRLSSLREELGGESEELHSMNSKKFWAEVRDVRLLPADLPIVWRVSCPPTSMQLVLAAAEPIAWFADWAGGLLWLGYETVTDGIDTKIRNALNEGGHATLIKAPEAMRRAIPVFQPEPAPLARLSARVKNSFDPKGILNPGRMVEGV
ncbi:MAG: FAD-binding protein [Alphaproteobacteria bacterium]